MTQICNVLFETFFFKRVSGGTAEVISKNFSAPTSVILRADAIIIHMLSFRTDSIYNTKNKTNNKTKNS